VAKEALARKVGARGLRMILEELMLDLMYHLPNNKRVRDLEINLRNGRTARFVALSAGKSGLTSNWPDRDARRSQAGKQYAARTWYSFRTASIDNPSPVFACPAACGVSQFPAQLRPPPSPSTSAPDQTRQSKFPLV